LRDAIDRYKDTADRGAIQIKVGSEGYPPDLETLVKGVDVGGKKIRFLRRIPTDPMTNSTEWDSMWRNAMTRPAAAGAQSTYLGHDILT